MLEKGTISAKGHILNNQEIMIESHTRMSEYSNPGKTKTYYYLNKPDSEIFESLKQFINHYNLKQ
jgi:hypothetical protein